MKWFLALLMFVSAGRAEAVEDSLRFGPFGEVKLYYESPRPANVVLFVSGDGGWNLGVVDMARSLARLDAVVAGVDIVRYLRILEASKEPCLYPAADFENLSKAVQERLGAPTYTTPILVGYSSGATLVYAALVQSSLTFKGAISLGFCPDLELTKPLCRGDGLEWTAGPHGKGYSFLPAPSLEVPWVALQGTVDKVCDAASTKAYVEKVRRGEIVMLPKVGHGFAVQKNWMPQFKAAFARIASAPAPGETPSPAEAPAGANASPATAPPAQARPPGGEEGSIRVDDLPLEEISASNGSSDALVILLSGDGGWGRTERGISGDLAQNGIGTVGWNSLRYYWKKRTPEEAAKDLTRIARHYMSAWHKTRLVLAGYSFGADVLPYLVNRQPPELRNAILSLVLIGVSDQAAFEFHFGSWFGAGTTTRYPTLPEIEKLRGMKITIFHGENDEEAACLKEKPALATCITLPGGHRIRGRYAPITQEILKQVK